MVKILLVLLWLLLFGVAATDASAEKQETFDASAFALDEVTGVRVEPGIESLEVSWNRMRAADRYKVQWRKVSETYHRRRERTTKRTSYTITRLEAERLYLVRVIAVADGMEDGPASREASGRPLPVPPNEAPESLGTLPPLRLDVGESARVDLTHRFSDPNDDHLFYTVQTADAATARATVAGRVVTVTGNWHGETTVTATATDRGGLSATQTFDVAVGNLLEFVEQDYFATEGQTLSLTVVLSEPRTEETVMKYSIGIDDDPSTANIDAGDFNALAGTARLAAGTKRTTIDIPIVDDVIIEPPREHLVVMLELGDSSADYAVRPSARKIAAIIHEGICDRTPGVRDGLRTWRRCETVTARRLASRQILDLRGRDIESLKEADFAGLTGLQALLLNENRLRTLPAGVFAGLEKLQQLHLHDNPGAPFTLTVYPFRTNAPSSAPPPAWIATRVREAAPFDMTVDLAIEGGAWTQAQTIVETGASRSASLFMRPRDAVVRIRVTKPPHVPSTRCGTTRQRCYQGIETRIGDSLTLFKQPPLITMTIPDQQLVALNDSLWIDLSALFTAADSGALIYSATSSDPALASVAVVDNTLIVTPNEDGVEGVLTITATATDADGLATEATFQVSVAAALPRFFKGWRLTLTPNRNQVP